METLLYVGSTKFTRLLAMVRLMNSKVANGFMPRKFFFRWLWSVKGCMHVLIIAYYTRKNMKI